MAIGTQPEVDDNNEGGGDSIFAEINITPLTDVFLVMVVIFMVSALAVQAERNDEKKQEEKQKKEEVEKESSGIKIILPPATADPQIDTRKASLVLEVEIEGNVYVAGKAMTDDKLDNLFHAAFQHDKNTQVVLKADKGVPHGRVVNLMERAKQTGLSRLAIGTGGQ